MGSSYLSGSPLFDSADPEHVEQQLVRAYGVRHFDSAPDKSAFRARAGFIQLPRVGLSYCNYETAVSLDFPEADYVRQQFVLRGKGLVWVGGRAYEIGGDRSFVTPAATRVRFDYSGGYEQLVLTVQKETLSRHLRHLLGSMPKMSPELKGSVDLALPEQRRLQRLVQFVAQELAAEHAPLPKSLMLEYEDALITAFLAANAGELANLFDREAKSMAPWQVRATEEFIEANWQSAITVELLAEKIGASARSIFKSFKDARGYSPMVFLKRTRLRHARARLLSPDPAATVTAVGLACGFHNLSHFAKDYMREFGESPSETLKRSKGAGIPH